MSDMPPEDQRGAPPPPPPAQPAYGQPSAHAPPPGGATTPRYTPATRPRNGVGTAALVLGILGLVLAILVLPAPLGALLGLIAVILGIVGISRVNQGVADNRGQAVTGLVTGAIGLILGVVIMVSVGNFFATHATAFSRLSSCLNDASTRTQQEQCVREFSDRVSTSSYS